MIREKRSIIGLLMVTAVLGLFFPAFPVEASKPSGWGIAELIETDNLEWSLYNGNACGTIIFSDD